MGAWVGCVFSEGRQEKVRGQTKECAPALRPTQAAKVLPLEVGAGVALEFS